MLPNYCPLRSSTHLYYSPTPFAPGGKLNWEVENTNFGFKHKGKLHVLWRVQHFCPSVLSREHSRKKKAGHAPSASPAKHWLCNLDVVVPAKTAQWCWLCYHLPLLLLLREKLSSLVGKINKKNHHGDLCNSLLNDPTVPERGQAQLSRLDVREGGSRNQVIFCQHFQNAASHSAFHLQLNRKLSRQQILPSEIAMFFWKQILLWEYGGFDLYF